MTQICWENKGKHLRWAQTSLFSAKFKGTRFRETSSRTVVQQLPVFPKSIITGYWWYDVALRTTRWDVSSALSRWRWQTHVMLAVRQVKPQQFNTRGAFKDALFQRVLLFHVQDRDKKVLKSLNYEMYRRAWTHHQRLTDVPCCFYFVCLFFPVVVEWSQFQVSNHQKSSRMPLHETSCSSPFLKCF